MLNLSTNVDIVVALIEGVAVVLAVVIGIRLGLTTVYRQTAEGWKARAEEAKLTTTDRELEMTALRERMAVLEAQPNLDEHARLLAQIARTLTVLDKRMESHESAAEDRHGRMVRAIEGLSQPRLKVHPT